MDTLTLRLLQMSLHGAVLILTAALLRRLLLRALPKGMLCLLWIPALLALALPLPTVFSLSVPVPAVLQTMPLLEEGGRKAAAPDAAGENMLSAAETADPEEAETGPAGKSRLRLRTIISGIWASGAGFMGLLILCLYGLELRRLRRAVPMVSAQGADWLREHPLRRTLRLRILPGLSGPMTYGILRPVILLPEEPDWEDPRTRLALEHEYVHVRHLDTAWKLLMNLLLAVHWFNPAVWLMAVLLGHDLELSCDEAVLLRLGSEQRADFAHMLLDTGKQRALAPYPGLGAGVLRQRIYSIMTFRSKGVFHRLLAAALVLGLTACAFGSLQVGAAGKRQYRNGGMVLSASEEVAELLQVEMPALTGEAEETLFRIYERETREAARILFPDSRRDYGLLLTIERMDEVTAAKYLSRSDDVAELLARDALGYCYMMRRHTVESNMLTAPDTEDFNARWERRKLVNQWVREVRQYMVWSTPIRERYPARSSAAASWFAGIWYGKHAVFRIRSGNGEEYKLTGFAGAEAIASRLIWESASESTFVEHEPEGEPMILTRPNRDKAMWFWEGSDLMLYCSDVGDRGYTRHYYTVRMLDAPEQRIGDLVREWYDAARTAAEE